ncbi:hypothetical protein BJ508DRAFT_79674 [Ascobolus immersus RN42]|uniref:Uncharacterized protein n=1 Tax=Ascobolus immersus RN42 TaxID=1160509 RepID=A0A3N4HCM3_ASCIM|nr:hypothetical protein BJ508DRAFT_79674 [Ascobolus immersus RN42]
MMLRRYRILRRYAVSVWSRRKGSRDIRIQDLVRHIEARAIRLPCCCFTFCREEEEEKSREEREAPSGKQRKGKQIALHPRGTRVCYFQHFRRRFSGLQRSSITTGQSSGVAPQQRNRFDNFVNKRERITTTASQQADRIYDNIHEELASSQIAAPKPRAHRFHLHTTSTPSPSEPPGSPPLPPR